MIYQSFVSLCVALLSTSISNVVVLRTASGDHPLVCPHLVRDLALQGLWTDEIRDTLLRNHGTQSVPVFCLVVAFIPLFAGSLRDCAGVPDDLKAVYHTIWDIDPAVLIDMAIDRAPYIDQSQSLTLGIRQPSPGVLVRIIRRHRICCS